eukprot:3420360-Amphidinium_carterae.1
MAWGRVTFPASFIGPRFVPGLVPAQVLLAKSKLAVDEVSSPSYYRGGLSPVEWQIATKYASTEYLC